MDAEALGVFGLAFDITFMEDPVDVHCGLGNILEKGGNADVIMGCCGGSVGGGVHRFAELLVFSFDGCAVVKSEGVGWVGQWVRAADWYKGCIFEGC